MIILSLTLILSIIINILFGWYIKMLLRKIETFTDGIIDFNIKVQSLSDHLEKVHELEMFYGEPVLQQLIKHMKITVLQIKEFQDSFIISEGEEQIQQDNNETGSKET